MPVVARHGGSRFTARVGLSPVADWERRILALLAARRLPEAARLAGEWRRARPRDAAAEHMAGDVAVRRFEFEFACERYRAATRLDPAQWTSWSNLSGAARYLGDWTLQVEALRQAVAHCAVPAIKPVLHSNLLVHLHATPGVDAATLQRETGDWVAAHAPVARTAPALPPRRMGTPLRVALVSGHLGGPIMSASLPDVLAAIDPSRLALTLVDTHVEATPPPAWRPPQLPVLRAPRGELPAIDSANFDLAIDLDGHAPRGVPRAFAHRLAPLQVSWLDWFNSTGLANMDYWLGDALSTPPGCDARFSERVWRLPHFRLPYRPHPELAAISTRQRAPETPLAFGAYGRIDKHHPALLDAWARILRTLPACTLTLKAGVFEAQAMQARYLRLFTDRGVSSHQLRFLGNNDYRTHLAAYAQVDVVLDSLPYNGGISTFDALSMGTPVLSVWGDTPVGRQSGALMTELGLPEFACDNLESYVASAIALGQQAGAALPDPAALRARFLRLPSADGRQFAATFTAALEQMWDAESARRAAAVTP